jgi:hypothetical protein
LSLLFWPSAYGERPPFNVNHDINSEDIYYSKHTQTMVMATQMGITIWNGHRHNEILDPDNGSEAAYQAFVKSWMEEREVKSRRPEMAPVKPSPAPAVTPNVLPAQTAVYQTTLPGVTAL